MQHQHKNNSGACLSSSHIINVAECDDTRTVIVMISFYVDLVCKTIPIDTLYSNTILSPKLEIIIWYADGKLLNLILSA